MPMKLNNDEEENATLIVNDPGKNHIQQEEETSNKNVAAHYPKEARFGAALCIISMMTWVLALFVLARADRDSCPSAEMSSENYLELPGNEKKTGALFREPEEASLSTTLSPSEYSRFVDQLRNEIALICIEMMQEDTAEKALQSKHIDITPLYNLVDKAFGTIGVFSTYQDVFPFKGFESFLSKAASSKGLNDFNATYIEGAKKHFGFHVEGIPLDRAYLPMPTGHPFWLPHYVGVITAEKLMRDGTIALYGRSQDKSDKTKFVTDAPSFLKELQKLQRKDDSDEALFHAENAFIWHYVAKEMSDLENYPIEIAFPFCGELMWTEEYIEHLGKSLGKQCRHGIGHGIFYAIAFKETMEHEAHSVLQQIRQGTLQLSEASICQMYNICKKAPNTLSYIECYGGLMHNLGVFGWKKIQTSRHYEKRCNKWNELAADTQAAAMDLGYHETLWNDYNNLPPGFNKGWGDLSEKQKEAAKKLGYDKKGWSLFYDAYSWSGLPKHVRVAAKTLQYDESSWARHEKPAYFRQDWKDLEARVQEAAKYLGYDEQSWLDLSSSETTFNRTSSDSN